MASNRGSLSVWLIIVLLVVLVALVWSDVLSRGGASAVLRGPKVVMSVKAPDTHYVAYVTEAPGPGGPTQSLFVETSDKRTFVCLGSMVPRIDGIEDIKWSPDSHVVVFHSKYWLTICEMWGTWGARSIYLGTEWKRSKPARGSAFKTYGRAIPDIIEFPKQGVVLYRLIGESKPHTVNLLP